MKKSELKDEHMIYMSDDMYLPIRYKGVKVEEPFYSGMTIIPSQILKESVGDFRNMFINRKS